MCCVERIFNPHTNFFNDVQTYIGDVVVSVNPYKTLDIYKDSDIKYYDGRPMYEVAPHVYEFFPFSFLFFSLSLFFSFPFFFLLFHFPFCFCFLFFFTLFLNINKHKK